jgi:NADH-quinone oxidoreductase subunit A
VPDLVLYLLIFLAVGTGFLAVNLFVGRLIRPVRPNAEKETIYECGEPSIGSSWIQFDLRFYVVALLFVIFDVEMAFFFPWSTVFGNATKLARDNVSHEERARIQNELIDETVWNARFPAPAPRVAPTPVDPERQQADQKAAAGRLAWIAFADILVFFGVLLVGFAYLWKRGDLDWVRSTAAQEARIEPQINADERRSENADRPGSTEENGTLQGSHALSASDRH